MQARRPFLFPRLIALLAAALCWLPAAAPAATADVLAAARAQQVAVYGLVRDFHMQTLLSGDPARSALLQQHVAAQEKLAATLAGSTGNAAADGALATARGEWATFRKLVLSNDVAKDGYTDENLVGDLYASADRLDKALGVAVAALQKAGGKAAAAHAANVLLQRTAAGYLKRPAQMSPDIGAEDTFDVGAATKKLDGMLQALQQQLAGDKDAESALRAVMTKWGFIKPSLLNYNERSVPFIVDRYAQQLSDGLTQLTVHAGDR